MTLVAASQHPRPAAAKRKLRRAERTAPAARESRSSRPLSEEAERRRRENRRQPPSKDENIKMYNLFNMKKQYEHEVVIMNTKNLINDDPPNLN
jgi:hypothetical protein